MGKSLKIISDRRCLAHETPQFHPERKARFLAVESAIESLGLLTPLHLINPRAASPEELLLCHTSDYISKVITEIGGLQDDETTLLSTGDVYICRHSLEASLVAAGSVLEAAEAVINGAARTVFVNARPPGHHATKNRGMGFCLFNNASLGAMHMIRRHSLERVLIIDWDVHHGNGTQDIFYDDPRVFYFSTHQEGIYPGTGFYEEQGAGKGQGTTMNRPIATGKEVFNNIQDAFDDLEEAMEKYRPQCVIISSGFDAHELDPLGGLKLKTEHFAWMTAKACAIASRHAEGRVISVLEGGYSLEGLYLSTCAHLTELKKQAV